MICVRHYVVIAVSLLASIAQAQTYPSKPVRIVTAEVGGAGDFVARLIAAGLTERFGQPVIVDNRPSGVIPGEIVSRATPDGYTLLNYGSTLWVGSLLRKTSYDAVRDFVPITLSQSSPSILTVQPTSSANSVNDLVALAKARPGELNYASVSTGSVTHLAGELFKIMSGVDIVRINYKGAASALGDLMGGRVQIMFAVAGSVGPYVKAGRLKALAVTSAQPSVLMPGVPTIAASGLPGYEAVSLNGVLAPAGTPANVIKVLNQEIVSVLIKPDVREKFLNSGVETVASTPERLASTVKSEIIRLGKVIKDAGIRAE